MITEDYVSFETAKLLKEKGFDGAFTKAYSTNGTLISNFTENCTVAPTCQMAMKWLREIHNLHIIIECGYGNRLMYFSNIKNTLTNDSLPNDTGYYNTYEEACEDAIKYCLENLI